MTPVIMMRGKLIKFVLEGNIKRWICDYSESGLGTPVKTDLGTTSWTTSMLPQSGNYGKMNFCWSKPISTSQTLFCYTGVAPFLVTYDGATTISYTTPTAPSTGTYSNYSATWSGMTLNTQTAIIGKNGNMLMLAYDTTNQWYALLEFSSTDLSFVKAAWTGIQSVPGTAMYLPRIRTTNFGYVIAIHSNASGANYLKYLHTATLADDYTRIATRTVETYEPNQVDTCNVVSSMIGSQSIMTVFYAGGQSSTNFGLRNLVTIDYSTTGALSGDTGSIAMSANNAYPISGLRAIIPAATGGNGNSVQTFVTTNIDGTAITGFCDYYPYFNNFYLYGSPYQTTTYYDFDIEPTPSSIRSAPRITTLCTKSFYHNDMAASGVAQDSNGLVFIDNSHSTQVNILFKKVYT